MTILIVLLLALSASATPRRYQATYNYGQNSNNGRNKVFPALVTGRVTSHQGRTVYNGPWRNGIGPGNGAGLTKFAFSHSDEFDSVEKLGFGVSKTYGTRPYRRYGALRGSVNTGTRGIGGALSNARFLNAGAAKSYGYGSPSAGQLYNRGIGGRYQSTQGRRGLGQGQSIRNLGGSGRYSSAPTPFSRGQGIFRGNNVGTQSLSLGRNVGNTLPRPTISGLDLARIQGNSLNRGFRTGGNRPFRFGFSDDSDEYDDSGSDEGRRFGFGGFGRFGDDSDENDSSGSDEGRRFGFRGFRDDSDEDDSSGSDERGSFAFGGFRRGSDEDDDSASEEGGRFRLRGFRGDSDEDDDSGSVERSRIGFRSSLPGPISLNNFNGAGGNGILGRGGVRYGVGGQLSGGVSGYNSAKICSKGLVLNALGDCVPPRVHNNVYVYSGPKSTGQTKPINVPAPELRRNVVYLNVPSQENNNPILVNPPYEETSIYVLKKNEQPQQKLVQVPSRGLKPKVYYVNYNDGENFALPGGISLQNAIRNANGAGLSLSAGGSSDGLNFGGPYFRSDYSDDSDEDSDEDDSDEDGSYENGSDDDDDDDDDDDGDDEDEDDDGNSRNFNGQFRVRSSGGSAYGGGNQLQGLYGGRGGSGRFEGRRSSFGLQNQFLIDTTRNNRRSKIGNDRSGSNVNPQYVNRVPLYIADDRRSQFQSSSSSRSGGNSLNFGNNDRDNNDFEEQNGDNGQNSFDEEADLGNGNDQEIEFADDKFQGDDGTEGLDDIQGGGDGTGNLDDGTEGLEDIQGGGDETGNLDDVQEGDQTGNDLGENFEEELQGEVQEAEISETGDADYISEDAGLDVGLSKTGLGEHETGNIDHINAEHSSDIKASKDSKIEGNNEKQKDKTKV